MKLRIQVVSTVFQLEVRVKVGSAAPVRSLAHGAAGYAAGLGRRGEVVMKREDRVKKERI